jgi:LmbE family N-acetylglucosaminyl deacetylase
MSTENGDGNTPPAKTVVLAIFAHPDDEIGCAGTMANHVDNGDEVHLLFLTKGENITNMDGSPEELIAKRRAHTDKIENLLGVKVHFMDFPDSRIEVTMEGGYKVATMLRKLKPNIVITDAEDGVNGHPDHVNTHKLVMDALSYCRFKDPNTDLPPHRSPINVYVGAQSDKKSRHELMYVDVSHQYQKIMDFIEIYKEAYGFPHMDKIWDHILTHHGLRNGNTPHAEVFEIKRGILRPYATLPTNPGFSSMS